MKIDTQEYTGKMLPIEKILSIIEEIPYNDHYFVVLFEGESGEQENYIQTTLEDESKGEQSPYLVEARVYQPNGTFIHYRTVLPTAKEVVPFFTGFYHRTPLSYSDWEEVTNEFLENE